LEWQKMLGSTSLDRPNDIYPTNDGGYIVVGIASWNDGDVTGNHGGFDYWVVKINGLGDVQWQKSLGGSDEDFAQSIQQTSDGCYIIAGYSRSDDGDVLGNDGGQDIWIVKLTNEGEIKWQKTFGGTQAERAYSIQQTSDYGYVLAGFTQSNNGDVSGFHGTQDFWVVKLSPESVNTEDFATQSSYLEIYPNPAFHNITLQIASEAPTLTICITDLLGRELSRQTIANGGSTDIAALPNGLYHVAATTPGGKVFSGKFRKQE